MLHNKRVLLLLLCICIAGFTNPTDAGCHPAVVHGDILDVHPQAGKVRVLTGHGMLILELDAGCRIMRGLQRSAAQRCARCIQGGTKTACLC